MIENKPENSEKVGLIVGVVFFAIALTLCLIPFVFSLDMMRWGYGIITFGFFAFVLGFITFVMYLYRYNRLNAIINGEKVIAKWIYTKEQFLQQVELKNKETQSDNKFKLGAIWFFLILFTIIFVIIGFSEDEMESMGFFIALMLGVAVFITFFAILIPKLTYSSQKKAVPVAIIAQNGLFYMGQLHTWNKPLAFIDSVKVNSEKKELVFNLKYFTKLGWYKYESYSVVIPIPESEMEKANEVVKAFHT